MGYNIPNAADAPYLGQSVVYSSNFNDLATGIGQSGATCEVTASTGMVLDVAAGIIQYESGRTTIGATTVEIGDNTPGEGGSNPRIDIVQVDWAGVVSVVEGDAAAVPVEPDVTAHAVKIAAVYVPSGVTEITQDMISDRRIGVTDAAVVSRGLPSTSFIYNSSSLEQVGTRYNSWSDLMDAVADTRFSGPRNILFEQDETIPAGAWNLDYITLLGNGQGQQFGVAAPASQIVVTFPTGVTISSWAFGKVAQGLKLKSTSAAPILTIDDAASTLAIQLEYGFIECTTAEFFKVEADALVTGGPTLAFAISGGGAVIDGGYEVVNAVADDPGYANVVMSMTGESGWVDAGTVRGSCIFGQIVLHPAANSAINPAQANLTNVYDISALGTAATLIAYTPTTAGDWTDATPASLAAAIDELADRVKTLEP
jgi:hypothetical protein